ncbi:MAG: AAA family ATPase [Mangrovibacterium sp.]|nr:AAA family ATPase [Mangrovibacterium sp.]
MIDKDLIKWKNAASHKPVLLRGARQVGKSSTVRELGKQFEYFAEVNFEKKENEAVKVIFERSSSPHTLCNELSAFLGVPIVAGRTLLFLDEIQKCIPAISSLRFFYEEMPDLHVVAAGSLLEFALEEVPSFGVGRISSKFMYPLSFDEFMRVMGFTALAEQLSVASPNEPFSDVLHLKCKELFLNFLLIGGMPEVVSKFSQGGSFLDCQDILEELTHTFYDDFAKYKTRIKTSLLREVFGSIIEQTGDKFTYSKASSNAVHAQIKESVDLLERAGLVYPVTHTSANGLPLSSETNRKHRKYLILDTGLYQRYLKLDLGRILTVDNIFQVNKGALAELFAGLELRKSAPSGSTTELYYWQREKQGSNAEVDYVVQQGERIVPVEVKAGTKGSMQSMYSFLEEKKYAYGIRCSMENFGIFRNIRIYPLYAAGKIAHNNNSMFG